MSQWNGWAALNIFRWMIAFSFHWFLLRNDSDWKPPETVDLRSYKWSQQAHARLNCAKCECDHFWEVEICLILLHIQVTFLWPKHAKTSSGSTNPGATRGFCSSHAAMAQPKAHHREAGPADLWQRWHRIQEGWVTKWFPIRPALAFQIPLPTRVVLVYDFGSAWLSDRYLKHGNMVRQKMARSCSRITGSLKMLLALGKMQL